MKKTLQQILLQRAAKLANDVVRREEGKWPPDCELAYYQPERPMTAPKLPPEQSGK